MRQKLVRSSFCVWLRVVLLTGMCAGVFVRPFLGEVLLGAGGAVFASGGRVLVDRCGY